MGLNLPIKTILLQLIQNLMVFQKKISVNEIVQIAGRAGRFGLLKLDIWVLHEEMF